ncbi:MAG TPA: hypothetical protein VEF04_18515, partial [Blastocatellia bacterium]|nr:hypothetical protein [Blastocatellia bacterium]
NDNKLWPLHPFISSKTVITLWTGSPSPNSLSFAHIPRFNNFRVTKRALAAFHTANLLVYV